MFTILPRILVLLTLIGISASQTTVSTTDAGSSTQSSTSSPTGITGSSSTASTGRQFTSSLSNPITFPTLNPNPPFPPNYGGGYIPPQLPIQWPFHVGGFWPAVPPPGIFGPQGMFGQQFPPMQPPGFFPG
ncbi:formin-B isoform X1 [Aethina tumida]|uniref:formin-B isoform X1 n=1 Tax=Aethina tumida TaxID=116153 RepID=UPI00096B1224|nr:formin-B isoform X1 [Aethina tumida]